MKGYKLDKTLYIFDATPATIPGTAGDEADLIYVQQELVEEFKSENLDNSAKIKPYNYKLMAVNKLPWADYIDNDLEGDTPTEYTVSVNFGQTLLKYLPDSLPFEPSLPYSATEGTQLVFTLPWEWGWWDCREGNTENQYVIQVQVPESIQNSYGIVWPEQDESDPENPVYRNGTLSFIMPAENVTLSIDLVENPDYIKPEEPTTYELTVVNNLPEGYTCEIATQPNAGDEEPVPVEDINSNIALNEGDRVFIKVFNENSEPVNYCPRSNYNDTTYDGYDSTHESNELMREINVYCSIEGDFNDEISTELLAYSIADKDFAENADSAHFGYGEMFNTLPIPLTLTIQKP